jgi:hypothetical protein
LLNLDDSGPDQCAWKSPDGKRQSTDIGEIAQPGRER